VWLAGGDVKFIGGTPQLMGIYLMAFILYVCVFFISLVTLSRSSLYFHISSPLKLSLAITNFISAACITNWYVISGPEYLQYPCRMSDRFITKKYPVQ
jgi:hypothetical protein